MLETCKKDSQHFTVHEIRKIRLELPFILRSRFPLKGESKSEIRALAGQAGRFASQAENARAMVEQADQAFETLDSYEAMVTGRREEEERQERAKAATYPTSYPVAVLREICRNAAVEGLADNQPINNLERELAEICLNPEWDFERGGPWYFSDLERTLRDYMRDWIAQLTAGVVVTALGKQVHDMLDYTLHSSSMTLLIGNARRGKSFAARSYCEQHSGQSRFIEVPTGNDDTSFYRAIARGLPIGKFSQYKAIELRERVESVLLTGDLVICLDEAQRLWPETNLRCGFPKRISWVMSMVNQGVPFCLIATPQFFDRQKLSDQIAGWNSSQLIGRLHDWKQLPDELSIEDLMAVARSILPEADHTTLRALAIYARTSARYLAAIDAIASRARYDAYRAG